MDKDNVIEIQHLNFRFDSQLPFVLKDVCMGVAKGRYERREG
jgi:hypothetical protein